MRTLWWCLVLCLGGLARAQDTSPDTLLRVPDEGGEERTLGGVGLFIGAPSSMGLTGQANAGVFLLRLSGGSWTKTWWGGQGDFGVIVSRAGALVQSIDVIAGRFSVRNRDENGGEQRYRQDYLGMAYAVSYGGFLVEIGLGSGRGDFPNPQLIYQFGYMIHF
jgi:hypothetical protein